MGKYQKNSWQLLEKVLENYLASSMKVLVKEHKKYHEGIGKVQE